MGRQLSTHALDERHELRHEVGHQEEHHEHDHRAGDGRIHEQTPHEGHLLVLPLQVLVEAAENLAHPARQLAGPDQVDEDGLERPRVLAHRSGEGLAPFDRFDHAREHLAQAGVDGRVAQGREPFDHRHSRGHELLHVKAESDEIAASHAAPAE